MNACPFTPYNKRGKPVNFTLTHIAVYYVCVVFIGYTIYMDHIPISYLSFKLFFEVGYTIVN